MHAATLTRLIPVASLRHWKNPRGEGFTIEDLLESFGRTPQLQNVLVRRVPGAREEYEVISGHRRVEAARQKGWGHVEAKVVDVDDLTAEVFALEENLRRKALPDEIGALARLVEIYEETSPTQRGGDRKSKAYKSNGHGDLKVGAMARAAKATGQSVREVRRKARIGKLGTPALRQALSEGRMTLVEAEQVAGLPEAEQNRQARIARAKTEPGGIPTDLRRTLDALRYAEKVLAGKKPGMVSGAVLDELRVHVQAVSKVLVVLTTNSRRTTSTRLVASARTTKLKPEREKVEARSDRDASAAVHFEPRSCNRKLGPVGLSPGKARPHFSAMRPFIASTSVSIQATCPDSCGFKTTPGGDGRGCYYQAGFTAIRGAAMDAASWHLKAEEVIAEEARQIDAAFRGGPVPQDGARGGRDLRLHVGGDVGSSAGAKLLAGAAKNWRDRAGGSVFSFTHLWREIARSAWGKHIAILASVETGAEIEAARQRGYPAAIVVEDFPNGDKAFSLPGTKARVIPCPAETRGRNCVDCRLCLDVDLLKINAAIAFRLHGQQQGAAKNTLAAAQQR